jgi:tRNA(Ile)-lysidine synthase TilS/MesJ
VSDSWLDRLPSYERQRIRERLRSPEEYERLREKVKGPEDLEREMARNEQMAELAFALETEPRLREALQDQIVDDIRDHGLDAVVEGRKLSKEAKAALEAGRLSVTVRANPATHMDQIAVVPEGTVQEALPITLRFSEQYLGQFKRAA